jgi:AraC-like DNA-binding protein
MRVASRRGAPEMRREIRLCDTATFARLRRARDFLGSSYTGRLTLEDGARQACLSPFHFNRLFTRAFGETPHEFVTRLRIDTAKRMLLTANQSVTEICFEVGYKSLGSFSARFRSLAGLSPSAFRREAHIAFGGFAGHCPAWPLYYIPACFQQPSLTVR